MTSISEIPKIVAAARAAFNTGRTRSKEWRRAQLERCMQMLKEKKSEFCDALKMDLNKNKIEALMMEVDHALNECIFHLNNFEEWMKPRKVEKDLINVINSAFIHPDPLGVVLNISPWNYPFQLVIFPLIGAISSGNCMVMKPSELAPHTSKAIEKYCNEYLDTDCIKFVQGAIPETTELLKEKFDHVFYTGNSFVAKIIMEAAAKHLTPVTLELGGKSPAFVDTDSDLDVMASRLLWGKLCNAGQTCIAPDYIMCQREIQDQVIEKLKTGIKNFYGENPKESPDYGRIISAHHVRRVSKLMQSGEIAYGGEVDEASKYICPTILKDVKLTDPAMQEEIFGPLIPIVAVNNAEHAIEIINQREKPLAMYIFSNNKQNINGFLTRTSSGSVCVNDTVVQCAMDNLPFGGVGWSGMGSYHGKKTFETFSHMKACLWKDQILESVNAIRYPPYTDKKYKYLRMLTSKSVKKGFGNVFIPFLVLGLLVVVATRFYGSEGPLNIVQFLKR